MQKAVFVIFFLGLTMFSYAQRFTGGILAGINATQVDGDTYFGYNKLGFMGGVYVYTPVSENLNAGLEIKCMGKGANKPSTEADPTLYTSHLNYIEVPVILRYQTKYKVFFEGGLGLGYLFSHYEEDATGELPADQSPHFKKYEFSFLLGLGYNLTQRLSARLRYSYSIVPIIDYPKATTTTYFNQGGAYNNVFSMGLFYDLKKK
jgi:hypothetical protein